MRRLPVLLALSFALAACSQSPEPAAPATTPEVAVQPESKPAEPAKPAAVPGRLARALPRGIELPFPYYAVADKTRPNKAGQVERRIRVELTQGDAASTITALEQAMKAGGFRAGKPDVRPDGSVRISFNRKGFGRVTAIAKNVAPAKPVSPAAIGSLTMVWPVAEQTAN